MFELLLAACLTTQTDICAERFAPPALRTLEECRTIGAGRASEWAKAHGLAVASWRCVDRAGLAEAVEPLAVQEIADGVFVHRGLTEVPTPENAGDLANLGFVVGADAVAVIDAGGSLAVGERLYAAIRVRTELPIGWLILTHMHPDHTLGAGVFQEAGATVVGHGKLGAALANRSQTYATNMGQLLGPRAFLGTALVAPDASVGMGEIDLGGRVIELRAYPPAHTDNDLSVFDRRTATLFTGDLVFAVHTPAIDGSILGWQRVLDALVQQEVRRIVPGHGPETLPWPGGADAIRAYLAALTEETRAVIRQGESMRSAIEHLGESQRPHWELFDEFNPRNATAAYKELEWE